jgi:hypothetical protein
MIIKDREKASCVALVLFLLLTVAFQTALKASEISEERARLACENFLAEQVYEQNGWREEVHPYITGHKLTGSEKSALFYIYSVEPSGFVAVSACSTMPPILAYSQTHRLDSLQAEGFIDFLIKKANARSSRNETHPGWQAYLQNPADFKSSLLNRNTSRLQNGPIVTTSWHQNSPYNRDCPEGDGSLCMLGCVATAGAQIMNYWQWPPHGRRTNTYWWEGDIYCGDTSQQGQYLTADFSDYYDWPNIPDSCDNGCSFRDSAALGELNYEVANALETIFSVCGSAVFGLENHEIYHEYFFYSPQIEIAYCNDYSLPEWFGIIQNEIDNNRPVHYFSFDHSLVLDGYRYDGQTYEIHLNYGWGGPFTGWYVLDELTCDWNSSGMKSSGDDYMYIGIEPWPEAQLRFVGAEVIDTLGNGDGHASPGETIELELAVSNDGWDAYGVRSEIENELEHMLITNYQIDFADTVYADSITVSSNNFEFRISNNCPDPYYVEVKPSVYEQSGDHIVDSFILYVGNQTSFYDGFEDGQGFWRHESKTEEQVNEWHIDYFRSHSGQASFKAGGEGLNHYSNNSAALLISPPFLLPPEPRLKFWHYLQTPLLGRLSGDGGTVFISDGINPPELLVPEGGYTHFLDSLPCYSGSFGWSEAEFDLADYSGVYQIIFLFRSDLRATAEGWYVDDFRIFSGIMCGDANSDDIIDISDMVYIINYVFMMGSPAPEPACRGDASGDDVIDVTDAVYLMNYTFGSGSPPPPGCCD